ncbi:MAG TPA: hypothetical protein VGI39_32945 [Polyangiaceae bacterium]|jgi:hypothetical protein
MSDAHPPAPAEPKTPMWLPALGAFLFFAVGVWWLASSPAAGADESAAAPAVDAGAAAPSAH